MNIFFNSTFHRYMPRKKAYQIALGNCDVNNGKKLANFDPENFKVSRYVIIVHVIAGQ